MRARFKIVIGIIIVIPLGFGLKLYTGPFHAWCNLYGAAVLYEVFWCLAARLFFTKTRHVPVIAATVFVITCVLEVLQLWHPPLLEAVRSTFIGVTLIGNGFDWFDFPHYFIGCLAGFFLLKLLD